MVFQLLRMNYDQVRQHADQFLDEYHVSRELPIPIEAIVEFDLSMTIVPLVGLQSEIGVDAFLTSDLNSIYLDEWVIQFAARSTGRHVRALPVRAHFELRFPRVQGYTQAVRNRVAVDWDSVPELVVDPAEIPPEVFMSAVFANTSGGVKPIAPKVVKELALQPYLARNTVQKNVFATAAALTRRYATLRRRVAFIGAGTRVVPATRANCTPLPRHQGPHHRRAEGCEDRARGAVLCVADGAVARERYARRVDRRGA